MSLRKSIIERPIQTGPFNRFVPVWFTRDVKPLPVQSLIKALGVSRLVWKSDSEGVTCFVPSNASTDAQVIDEAAILQARIKRVIDFDATVLH